MASVVLNTVKIDGSDSLKDFLETFSENDQEKYRVKIETWLNDIDYKYLTYRLKQTPQEDIEYYNHICSPSYPIEQIVEDPRFKQQKQLEELICSFIYLACRYPNRIRMTKVAIHGAEGCFNSVRIFEKLNAIAAAYPQETREASTRLAETKVKIQAYLNERNKKLASLIGSFEACFPRSFMISYYFYRFKLSQQGSFGFSMDFASAVGLALVSIPYLLLLSLVLLLSSEFRNDFLDQVRSRQTAFSKLRFVFHALFATSSIPLSICLAVLFLPGLILGGSIFLLLEAGIHLGIVFSHLAYRIQFERQKAENEDKVVLALEEYFAPRQRNFFQFLKQCVYRPTVRNTPSSSLPDATEVATETALAQQGVRAEEGVSQVGFLTLPVEIREAIAAKYYELAFPKTAAIPYWVVARSWDAIRSGRGASSTRIIANFEEDRVFAGTSPSISPSPSSQD